ncbi:hypothetical protein OG723_44460 (plasmid) [Streptomyces sp. NBC_01278]|uniref:hypothetical protein n=1 Tax=Streptomyces sp. NBC_01278 TaxID=2903809 RepID=UPI002E32AFB2|nr:hypothetical protein [Streptomyces sp. NBC_01278]
MKYTAPLTAEQVQQLGEDIGRITAFTARALHREFPHLNLERLVTTLTGSRMLDFTTAKYLAAMEAGASPAEAAGQAGVALVRVWADARLQADEELDRATPAG